MPAILKYMKGEEINTPPLHPPFIKDGDVIVGQTSNVLLYLAPKIGLAPKVLNKFTFKVMLLTLLQTDVERIWANQIMLTICDVVQETHDTHHPVDVSGWYKEQIPEATRRAKLHCSTRLPKFLEVWRSYSPLSDTYVSSISNESSPNRPQTFSLGIQ